MGRDSEAWIGEQDTAFGLALRAAMLRRTLPSA
jgi:hypothetical protein